MITRIVFNSIKNKLFKKKAIIIYGARQVGKTTLIRSLLEELKLKSIYLNCDEPDIRRALENRTSTELKHLIGQNAIVALDEAQRVKNIGLTIKILVDNFPDLQVIATGSSSLDLSNDIKEPLTGRKFEFQLFPLSFQEIIDRESLFEGDRLLEQLMVYGSYPDVYLNAQNEGIEILREITDSYLYRDILQFQNLRKPEILEKLLQALALQVGNEVSMNELSSLLGVDKNTISSYIRLLEQSFVVFKLTSFSRNLRNELKKRYKIYFYDNGIRNTIINNMNPLSLRQDTGALWENFIISERTKRNAYKRAFYNKYFWRTYQQQEIDYLEERNQKLHAYEIKWKKKKVTAPKGFLDTYPNAEFTVIDPDNYLEFIS